MRLIRTSFFRRLAPLFALVLLAAVPRLVNLLALDPISDEVEWLHWANYEFDWRVPATHIPAGAFR